MGVEDGGPAFPVGSSTTGQGMSLRDYFAGRALQGLMAGRGTNPEGFADIKAYVAAVAYRYADAMLEARDANGDRR